MPVRDSLAAAAPDARAHRVQNSVSTSAEDKLRMLDEVRQTPMNDHDLMEIRADTLWTYDARRRMLRSRSPDNLPAPRLFFGRTRGGHVLRFGEPVPASLVNEVTAIVGRQPAVNALPMPPSLLAELRETLSAQAPVTAEGGGPAYRFPDEIVVSPDVVEVTVDNLDLVRQTFPWLYQNLAGWGRCFAAVQGGAAVSICFSSRIGVQAMEAGLFTLPEFRGQGHAVAVTAAWGAAVRDAGRDPVYSTGWDNLASQAVARRVGLTMFGVDASWT
jgi:hypothetical protein